MLNKQSNENETIKKTPNIFVGGILSEKEIKDFYDRLESTDKKFDKYIVLYIDFLGIKEKIKGENSYESLQILKLLFLGTKKTAQYIGRANEVGNYDIKIFSDNVIIAQKVNEEKLGDQLISIVNLAGQIQFQALMQFDFLLRGALTIGELAIDNLVVWGSGLIEAYELENEIANFPRIIISKQLLNTYDYCKKSLNLYALLNEDDDGLWFVDYLSAIPNLKMIPIISKTLKEKRTSYVNESDKAKQKFNWVISYFNSQCRKFKDRGNFENYVLPFV